MPQTSATHRAGNAEASFGAEATTGITEACAPARIRHSARRQTKRPRAVVLHYLEGS
jgi:hypothetical protein